MECEVVSMYIVAIAWIYVILMMSIAEHTVIAGIMTFLLYGVLPLTIILYLMGTPQRRRRRAKQETILSANDSNRQDLNTPTPVSSAPVIPDEAEKPK